MTHLTGKNATQQLLIAASLQRRNGRTQGVEGGNVFPTPAHKRVGIFRVTCSGPAYLPTSAGEAVAVVVAVGAA